MRRGENGGAGAEKCLAQLEAAMIDLMVMRTHAGFQD